MTENIERPLGDWLRRRREELEIDLNQAEIDTRIRRRSLEALEAEEFDALPDLVVGRGFLRNYAAYLGLDPHDAAARYARLVSVPLPEPTSVNPDTPFHAGSFRPVPLHQMPGFMQRRGWWAAALLLLLVLAVVALGWWYYPRLSTFVASLWPADAPTTVATPPATRSGLPLATTPPSATATTRPTQPATATATAPAEAPTSTPTWTPTWTPSPSPSPSPQVYTGIFIELAFTGTSWVQVTVDGVREFQGEMAADTYRSWYGQQRVELRIGNAGVVLVTINGQSLGALGADGEVIDRVFEKVGDDVTAGTATASPEPTSEAAEPPGAGDTPAAPTDTPPPPTDTLPPPTQTTAPPPETPTPTPGG
ncbi:MAG: helix-turn-helix domain-containing protein [Anaerolineae bacterium]|nr:helix-turn-helix domain-containing protein [Anaerolineae bacterium]